MSDVVAAMSPMPRSGLLKFFKTPKGLLVIALSLLIPLAATASGFAVVAPGVAAAAAAAMLVDAPILRYRDKEWSFPSGALLTGLLVAMVLSPFGSWKIAAMTAAIGVLSKYVARGRSANVFNPAALALVQERSEHQQQKQRQRRHDQHRQPRFERGEIHVSVAPWCLALRRWFHRARWLRLANAQLQPS